MTQNTKHYILTLSCFDKPGIVAMVSRFLLDQGGFIIESAQYGDPSTQQFFMRCEFTIETEHTTDTLTKLFEQAAQNFEMKFNFFNLDHRPRMLLAVTKENHCLASILNRYESGSLAAEIPAIISNHKTLEPLAQRHNIPFYHFDITKENKIDQEEKILKLFHDLGCDLLVLARYMQILSPAFCHQLPEQIINIHHSFLPGFKGANPYKQAFDRGVKIIGATAHYVTDDLDEGPIIEQEVIRVSHHHSPSALRRQGQDIESQVLLRALTYHTEHRILLNGNKTVVFQ